MTQITIINITINRNEYDFYNWAQIMAILETLVAMTSSVGERIRLMDV